MKPGDREHGDPDPVDVDARPPRRLGVAADGVDVAAEARPVGDERPEDEETRRRSRRRRHAAVLVRVPDGERTDDGRRRRAGARSGRAAGARRRAPSRPHLRQLEEARRRRGRQAQRASPRRRGGSRSRCRARRRPGSGSCPSSRPRGQDQDDTAPGEEPASVTTKDGHPRLGDDQPVQRRSPTSTSERDRDRRPTTASRLVWTQESVMITRADAADEADREVDLARSAGRRRCRSRSWRCRRLQEQVDEVPLRVEVLVESCRRGARVTASPTKIGSAPRSPARSRATSAAAPRAASPRSSSGGRDDLGGLPRGRRRARGASLTP